MTFIGEEMPGDAEAREALLDRAMGPARRLKPSELLRAGREPASKLALAARGGGRLVGTVRLWNITAGGRPALLLGPLAVDPASQGQGIGSRLLDAALARAAALGHGAVILVGDPGFYEPFGFTAAATRGLVMPAPVEARRFLGLEFDRGALAGATGPVTAAEPVAMPMPRSASGFAAAGLPLAA